MLRNLHRELPKLIRTPHPLSATLSVDDEPWPGFVQPRDIASLQTTSDYAHPAVDMMASRGISSRRRRSIAFRNGAGHFNDRRLLVR
jgi:hypothetical protein